MRDQGPKARSRGDATLEGVVLDTVRAEYHYGPVEGSPFYLVLVIPVDETSVGNPSVEMSKYMAVCVFC